MDFVWVSSLAEIHLRESTCETRDPGERSESRLASPVAAPRLFRLQGLLVGFASELDNARVETAIA